MLDISYNSSRRFEPLLYQTRNATTARAAQSAIHRSAYHCRSINPVLTCIPDGGHNALSALLILEERMFPPEASEAYASTVVGANGRYGDTPK